MRIKFKTPQEPGAYLHICRADGSWTLCGNKDTEIEKVSFNDAGLGLDRYRVIVQEDGQSALVIRFADLHRHSDYSLMDGMTKVPEMVKRTEYAGALTDHGNMYGFLEHYKAMRKAGKKPILGFEAYQESLKGELEGNHLILLAKNFKGYQNLLKLTSESFDHFYRKPYVTWEMLKKYHEGIIVSSACLGGIIPRALMNGNPEAAEYAIKQFQTLFGEDFYLEIQRHGIKGEEQVNQQILALGKKYGIQVIATTDSHYPAKEDKAAHEVLLCAQTKKTMAEPHFTFEGTGYHMHTSEEMEALFSDIPEVLDNTLRLAEKCNVELKLGEVNLPYYEIPKAYATPMDYFRHLCEEGFQNRFAGKPQLTDPAYKERFDYEMAMIEQMGFASYFIIVWDFINFARKNNIYVGPGRGSAAGSLLAYCIGITDMDPIRFNLLFERFLNPERVSWPDIDTDIEHSGRAKVIDYITKKYGAESVCRIVTFGTMAARMVLKDVARVLGYPTSWANSLAKLVPEEPGMTLVKALDKNPELKEKAANDPDVARVMEVATKLEGNKRHASQHACFDAETLITTETGPKRIVDVQVGEKVLTHMGRYKEVVDFIVTITDIVYTVYCDGKTVKVTGNHPLLVRTRDGLTGWMKVEDLRRWHKLRIMATDGTAYWEQIDKITTEVVENQVMYNLTVLDDSSYVANGIVAHNCGLVIAPGSVSDYLPTSMEKDSETGDRSLTSQVTMTEVEDLSLIKMDLLGLKNLTAIHEVIDTVKRTRGIDTTYEDLPLDDRETYKMLSKGITGGVFQLEGGGMTNNVIIPMLSDIDTLPDSQMHECFERLIAAVALYRPGPMDYIPNYIEGMRNPSTIHYLVPELESILKPTYGVIVYQEQVMQIVQKLAGYTLGRADVVRKAMGKKKHDVMAAEKIVFIHGNKKAYDSGKDKNYAPGCVANGIPEAIAEEIWAQMEKFASYAFNRSHAACYAWLASITAYMSCHWAPEFYCAMMNAFEDVGDKVKGYMALAVRRGIKILPPDINKSSDRCVVEDGCIRLGFHSLAYLDKFSHLIAQEKAKNGPYADFQDFYERLTDFGKKPGKNVLESLIFSGALESFGLNHNQLVSMIPLMEKDYKKSLANRQLGQLTMFSPTEMKIKAPEVKEFTDQYLMEKEKTAIGFYLTKHPVDEFFASGQADGCTPITEIVSDDTKCARMVTTVGLIRDLRTVYTKAKQEEMFLFTAEDRFNEIPCVLFPKYVAANKHRLMNGALVKIVGEFVYDEQRGPQIIVQSLTDPGSSSNGSLASITVTIHNKEEQEEILKFARENPGTVVLKLLAKDKVYQTNRAIRLTPAVLDFLQERFSKVEV